MKTIKVGVIGVGYLGRFHAQKYSAMKGVDLVGVADTNSEQVESVAKECGCLPFADYKELLKKVDAVSIVVPTTLHHKISKECISCGVDLLLEKPMTVTIEEADELIRLAEEKDLILQIGHLERFNPAVLAMQPHLTTPVFIESNRIAMFNNRGNDVDVVLDLMIHDIDIILSIVDSPLADIHTVGAPVVTRTTDIANARLMFENGATANVTVSRISRTNVRNMRVFQPGSLLNVDFGNKKITTIQLTDQMTGSGMPEQKITEEVFSDGDALKSEAEHFIENVRNRTQPIVSGHEGRRALDVALKVIEQIKKHRELSVFKDSDFSTGQ